MFKTINRIYSRLYYKALVYIWDKFANNKHWQTIHFVFKILTLKNVWYDKINKIDMTKVVLASNPEMIKREFQNINIKMNSRTLSRKTVLYKISFIIQKKIILESNLEEKSYDVDKKIFFVKIGTQNFPIDFAKKMREYLTLSVFNYLNYKVKYQKFSNLEEKEEKIFLEIETLDELEKLQRFLNRYFKEHKTKNRKYVKRKFGASETILNVQHIWNKEMTFNELVFIVNKLHHLKHDYKNEHLTIEDLIS